VCHEDGFNPAAQLKRFPIHGSALLKLLMSRANYAWKQAASQTPTSDYSCCQLTNWYAVEVTGVKGGGLLALRASKASMRVA
jgi:hypothetical protein